MEAFNPRKKPLLEIKSISKKYRSGFFLESVNIELFSSEIVGLLGPNGAGKSTTFKLIMGLDKENSGEIFFNEFKINNLPVYKRARMGIGYISQSSLLIEELSVLENLKSIIEMRKDNISTKEIEDHLDKFGILQIKDQKVKTLSGGERKKLELIRTIILKPELILCDEPFTSLDPKTIKELLDILIKLKNEGKSIFITDHRMEIALSICNRAYLLVGGKIIYQGSSQDILESKDAKKYYWGD